MENNWTLDVVRERLKQHQFDISNRLEMSFSEIYPIEMKTFISWIGSCGIVEIECNTKRISMNFDATYKGKTYRLIVGPHLRDSNKVFIITIHPVD